MLMNLEETLEQIEKEYWGEPTYDSYLVTTCHQLRKKPLKDFTTEDLRMLIGQNISLDLLIPLAYERLCQNIMASGDMYPGDLLQNVLSAEMAYWEKNPSLHRKIRKLFKNNLPSIEKRVHKSISKSIFSEIQKSFEGFSKLNVS